MAYNILIVDDQQIMRKLLRKILSVKHNIVGEAKNGVEAIEKFKQLDIDLIILDVRMPKKDGFETISEIKELDENQKVIMCTSVDNHDNVMKLMEKGADAYMVKPYKKDKLLDTIDEVMN